MSEAERLSRQIDCEIVPDQGMIKVSIWLRSPEELDLLVRKLSERRGGKNAIILARELSLRLVVAHAQFYGNREGKTLMEVFDDGTYGDGSSEIVPL